MRLGMLRDWKAAAAVCPEERKRGQIGNAANKAPEDHRGLRGLQRDPPTSS